MPLTLSLSVALSVSLLASTHTYTHTHTSGAETSQATFFPRFIESGRRFGLLCLPFSLYYNYYDRIVLVVAAAAFLLLVAFTLECNKARTFRKMTTTTTTLAAPLAIDVLLQKQKNAWPGYTRRERDAERER